MMSSHDSLCPRGSASFTLQKNTPVRLLQNPSDDTEVVPPYCKTGRFHHLLEGRAPSRPSALEVLQEPPSYRSSLLEGEAC